MRDNWERTPTYPVGDTRELRYRITTGSRIKHPRPLAPVSNDFAIRARAEDVLAKCTDSRCIVHGRYKPVTVTVGEAEQLARDVLELLEHKH